MKTFHPTNHAIQRWRQRGAQYADENVFDVIKAAQEAVPVAKKDLPFGRKPGMSYRFHESSKTYFVIEAVNKDEGRIVTVIAGR